MMSGHFVRWSTEKGIFYAVAVINGGASEPPYDASHPEGCPRVWFCEEFAKPVVVAVIF